MLSSVNQPWTVFVVLLWFCGSRPRSFLSQRMIPTLSMITWRFQQFFWYEYSWHNWPSNDRLSSHLTQRMFLHPLWKNEICAEMNKQTNKFHLAGSVDHSSPDLSLFAYAMFAVSYNGNPSYNSESTRRRLGMLMNSRIDWSVDCSGAEHYRHCYRRMEKAYAYLYSHNGPIFRTFTCTCTCRIMDRQLISFYRPYLHNSNGICCLSWNETRNNRNKNSLKSNETKMSILYMCIKFTSKSSFTIHSRSLFFVINRVIIPLLLYIIRDAFV